MLDVAEGLGGRQEVIRALSELCSLGLPPSDRLRLEEQITKLKEAELFLSIIGHVKRGKSTLVNALLGSNLLPTGVTPVTSVITKVRYGEEARALVRFEDGRSDEIEVEGLEHYTTEEKNPNNVKNVREVVVSYPSPLLRDGVVLVDTPGIGSIYLKDVASTYEFMDRTDAAIFVLSVDPPIGKEELELLHRIRLYASKLFFVLNKVDYVSEAERERVLGYTSKVISDALDLSDVRLFPLSAKSALEGVLRGEGELVDRSGLNLLRREIALFLAGGKEEALLKSASGYGSRLIGNLEISYRMQLASLQKERGDLTLRLEWLKALPRRLEDERFLLEEQVEASLRRTILRLDSDLDAFVSRQSLITADFMESFLAEKSQEGVGPRQLEGLAEKVLADHLNGAYEDFIRDEDERVRRAFSEIVQRVSDGLGGLVGEVTQRLGDEFGLKLEPVTPTLYLQMESGFRPSVEPLFGRDELLLSELPKLLPNPLLRKVLHEKIREKAQSELERNKGRARYFFVSRLEEATRRLKGEVVSHLSSLSASLLQSAEQIERDALVGQEERAERIREIEGRIALLSRLKPSFGRYLGATDGEGR